MATTKQINTNATKDNGLKEGEEMKKGYPQGLPIKEGMLQMLGYLVTKFFEQMPGRIRFVLIFTDIEIEKSNYGLLTDFDSPGEVPVLLQEVLKTARHKAFTSNYDSEMVH